MPRVDGYYCEGVSVVKFSKSFLKCRWRLLADPRRVLRGVLGQGQLVRSTLRPSWTARPGLQHDSGPAVVHPALGAHGEGRWSSPKAEPGRVKIAKAGYMARV